MKTCSSTQLNRKRIYKNFLLLEKNYRKHLLAQDHLNFDKWKTFYIFIETEPFKCQPHKMVKHIQIIRR